MMIQAASRHSSLIRVPGYRGPYSIVASPSSATNVIIICGRRHGGHGQTRPFYFGLWSSRLCSDTDRVARRRRRVARYRYMESMNKRQCWEIPHSPSNDAHFGGKALGFKASVAHFVHHPGQFHSRHSCSSWDETHRTKPQTDDLGNGRPGQNIEDVERDALDHLFRPAVRRGSSMWRSPAQHIRDYLHSQLPDKDQPADGAKRPKASVSGQGNYIDPITNRKVARTLREQNSDTQIYKPVKTSRSQELPVAHNTQTALPDDLERYNTSELYNDAVAERGTPVEGQSQSDLDKYRPRSWTKSDLNTSGPQPSPNPDVENYNKPFTVRNAILDVYDQAQQVNATTRGKPLPPKAEVAAEEPERRYEDLEKYGSAWEEPESDRASASKSITDEPEDLPKYIDFDAGKPVPESFEQDCPPLSELKAYENFDNGDKKTSQAVNESKVKTQDLDGYEVQSLDTPSPMYGVPPEDPPTPFESLKPYRSEFLREQEELEAKIAQTSDNNIAAESPTSDYNEQMERFQQAAARKPRRSKGTSEQIRSPDVQRIDALTAEGIRARVLQKAHKSSSAGGDLERAKANFETSWDASAEDARASLRQMPKINGPKMTGNYVRDFPEEFTKSWASSFVPSETAPSASAAGNASPKRPQEVSPSKLETSLDRVSTQDKRTPSMTPEESRRAENDPYSKLPQGLETSFAEECGGETPGRPTLVRHYSPKDTEKGDEGVRGMEESPSAETARAPLCLYLFYNQDESSSMLSEEIPRDFDTSDEISFQAVSDMELPKLPGEVLKRILSLQSQGFELSRGAEDAWGNVLFFLTKSAGSSALAAMDAPEIASPWPASSSNPAARRSAPPPHINPVDMMGRTTPPPVSGNFASPTGFVNYDPLMSDEGVDKPAPPFRSGIYVRKEEPVFSGGSATGEGNGSYWTQRGEGKGKGKRRLGRKLLAGTAWIVGGAYAVGVMGEYFRSGGVDGRGPKGF